MISKKESHKRLNSTLHSIGFLIFPIELNSKDSPRKKKLYLSAKKNSNLPTSVPPYSAIWLARALPSSQMKESLMMTGRCGTTLLLKSSPLTRVASQATLLEWLLHTYIFGHRPGVRDSGDHPWRSSLSHHDPLPMILSFPSFIVTTLRWPTSSPSLIL